MKKGTNSIIKTTVEGNITFLTTPYEGVEQGGWPQVTKCLIDEHPLERNEIVETVIGAWNEIFQSSIGTAQIGKDIFPTPQNMGSFLHELIPLRLARKYPSLWRREMASGEKDIVYIPNDVYSIEVKTSSSASCIFGNRSYAQPTGSGKKAKNGYYLAVNFEKFSPAMSTPPAISKVRFGWLDSTDWKGQEAASGQQSRLAPEIYTGKFELLFKK